MTLLWAGCTPDLNETVGPRVPVPNVTGQVIRQGVPVVDVKVELQDTAADTTVADERTDDQGYFAFSEVGPGRWTLQVKPRQPGDFVRVKLEFVFATHDTAVDVPAMDTSMEGLALRLPEDGETRTAPNPFGPVTFQWDLPTGGNGDRRFQVRVYLLDGTPFWFSQKTREAQIIWNGLGNQEQSQGELAQPGEHIWRLRVEDENGLEYDTESRHITFE